ncbi:MAG: YgjV family protein [Candidatus Marinimicrobia bacterium]|nr:YgjV family protein [Candidatus Neomarinimicrobiota bacterium]
MNVSLYEFIGYAATLIVAISLMMRQIRRLRIYNLIGSALFSLYGALIGAWPVAVLNGFIVLINIRELISLSRRDIVFKAQKVDVKNSWYLEYYLNFFQEDIKRIFPDFAIREEEKYESVIIMRDVLPASIVILRKTKGPEAEIILDFAHPEFRDMQNARYFFRKGCESLNLEGKEFFITPGMEKQHIRFLRKMHFKPHPQKENWYIKKIGVKNV